MRHIVNQLRAYIDLSVPTIFISSSLAALISVSFGDT